MCSKKITMPESAVIGCIAWDEQSGCLCCGAAGGLVKLISLETGGHGKASVSTATLDGHQAEGHRVAHCCWNAQHGKLTTADDSGHIIVWACQQGTWIEEMVNNRQCSVVSAIQWSPDGSRICIAYEDGAVIVGKVDGTRVWGKELELPLQHLAWSPSSRNILFTTRDGDVYLYDSDGNQISKMQLRCQEHARESNVAAITWCAAFPCFRCASVGGERRRKAVDRSASAGTQRGARVQRRRHLPLRWSMARCTS